MISIRSQFRPIMTSDFNDMMANVFHFHQWWERYGLQVRVRRPLEDKMHRAKLVTYIDMGTII